MAYRVQGWGHTSGSGDLQIRNRRLRVVVEVVIVVEVVEIVDVVEVVVLGSSSWRTLSYRASGSLGSTVVGGRSSRTRTKEAGTNGHRIEELGASSLFGHR